jgi:hypothetical protein
VNILLLILADGACSTQEKIIMSGALGLLIVTLVGGTIVTLCFVQDAIGTVRFWRAR